MRADRTGVSGLKEEDIQGSEGSFSWDMEPEGEGEVGSGKAGGQHAFSVKGQVINILGAKGQMVPVASIHLCHETGSPGLNELSCAPDSPRQGASRCGPPATVCQPSWSGLRRGPQAWGQGVGAWGSLVNPTSRTARSWTWQSWSGETGWPSHREWRRSEEGAWGPQMESITAKECPGWSQAPSGNQERKKGSRLWVCGRGRRRFSALRPWFPPAWPGNRLPLGTRCQRGGQLPWPAAGRQEDAARLPPLPYAWMPSPEGTGAPWWGAASGP